MATIYDLEQQAKTIEQQQEIIDRQRNALQLLLNAIWIHINAPDDNGKQLQDAYRLVTSGNDESILSIVTETKQELDAIIERQRTIIEKYDEAAKHLLDAPPGFYFDGDWDELSEENEYQLEPRQIIAVYARR